MRSRRLPYYILTMDEVNELTKNGIRVVMVNQGITVDPNLG